MVNTNTILYSDNDKYLGVYFDSSLSFHRYISNIRCSINVHLHSFRLIRNSISLSVSITHKRFIFYITVFDYCNILLFSVPGYQIKKITNTTEFVSTINFYSNIYFSIFKEIVLATNQI